MPSGARPTQRDAGRSGASATFLRAWPTPFHEASADHIVVAEGSAAQCIRGRRLFGPRLSFTNLVICSRLNYRSGHMDQ